jgi:hypothetical protein
MAITGGTRVTGHITTAAQRIEFAGTVTDTFRTGGKDAVLVACDDGQERTALAENVAAEEAHVTSVLGGKTHLASDGSPVPFPLCNSASRNTRTRFRVTTAPVDCKECAGIQGRRAARLAREAA